MIDNTAEKLLRQTSFPELSKALMSRLDAIVARWARVVRESLPAAGPLSKSQLHDSVPDLLHELGALLASTHEQPAQLFAGDSPEHGRVRYEQNFDLMQVMIEYSMLRRAVMEETFDALGRVATMEEQQALSVGMDVMIRRAVITFVNHLKFDIQADAEAQSKYLSFLSHDLRGGLNGILLMIEVLKRELSGTPQFAGSLEDLDLMRRSILDTVSTMDRFLHAERFRKGKMQVRPAALSLSALIPDLLNQVSHQARDKGLQIQSDVRCPDAIVSDKELLVMILSNLLANAVKYSKKGTVSVTCAPADGAAVRISVSDQGPGISPERLTRLFSAYERGDTHGEQGVGLGLSIARQAADLLGAKLQAESTVGTGTTFHLDLVPLADPKAH